MSYDYELTKYAEFLTNNLADDEEETEQNDYEEININYLIDIARGK